MTVQILTPNNLLGAYVPPSKLQSYLGISDELWPKKPSSKVILVRDLPKDRPIYAKQKDGTLVPFKFNYKADSLPDGFGTRLIKQRPGKNKEGEPILIDLERFEHAVQAVVDPNSGELLYVEYDLIEAFEGAGCTTGYGTGGSVTVPLLGIGNIWYCGFTLEYRTRILNPETQEQGCWIPTFPGGYSDKPGKGKEQAIKEIKEEMGIDVKDVQYLGSAVDNRTLRPVGTNYYCVVIDKDKISPEAVQHGDEKMFGKYLIPFTQFPLGLDGIVNTAWSFALKYLWSLNNPKLLA